MTEEKKEPRNPVRIATAVNPKAELDRLRAKTAEPLPLLAPESDPEDDDSAEIATLYVSLSGEVRRRIEAGPDAPPPEPVADSPEALPAGVSASLDVIDGPAIGSTFTLTTREMVVGRAATSHRLDDERVSRWHASFAYDGTYFRVRDLRSQNGVYLNGAKVTDYPLRDGDKVLLGGTTLLFRQTTAP